MWFGSRSNLAKLQKDDLCLKLGSIVINPSETVRDLGVLLNSELTMRRHIARTASTCFFHLRRLRKLRRCADQSTMQRLVSAFVIANLDHYNSVVAGLSASSLAPLNRVLSAAVRLVAGLGPRDHVTGHMKGYTGCQYRFGLNSNYVFSCMVQCMVKVLLTLRMFLYHSVIYQVTPVFYLLPQDNMVCLSLEQSSVVEHCP